MLSNKRVAAEEKVAAFKVWGWPRGAGSGVAGGWVGPGWAWG